MERKKSWTRPTMRELSFEEAEALLVNLPEVKEAFLANLAEGSPEQHWRASGGR
jgi:hypothetical protein